MNKNMTLLTLFERLGILLLLALFPFCLTAQETVVVGQVINKLDRTPVASVDIYFKGSNVAVKSNDEGYFLIRNQGKETTLVFSILGYKKAQLKLKQGDNVGVQMELEEIVNMLDGVFVLPGANPAKELMKNVRLKRKKNDVKTAMNSTEQSVVFLSKNDLQWQNSRLYEQFKSGNLSPNDSSLLVPLYMEQSDYSHINGKKEQNSKNTYQTTPTAENLIVQLLDGLDNRINFYDNAVNVLGKSLVSPLANIGNSYYKYFLTDSIRPATGKQYEVHFYSKNSKNLAFNGKMLIDSATLALTYINAELPKQANLNFIHNLQFEQSFSNTENFWVPNDQKSAWYVTYELLKDNLNGKPELLVKRNTVYSAENGTLVLQPDSFAGTVYSDEAITARMEAMHQTPLYKTAKFIADAALTGYFKAGKVDIGPLTTIMRLTEAEGFRLGLPVRTNEDLWKDFMLGAYGAYGFGSKEWYYGGEMQWKLPTPSRFIVGAKYINDYRRTDYDYSDFIWREDPLATGDHDIISTIFSFKKGISLNKRQEFTAFAYKDITPDIEMYLIYQNQKIANSGRFPFGLNGTVFPFLNLQSLALTGRFSFNERFIDGHFQRFYQKSPYPVIYATVEGGNYKFDTKKGNYMELILSAQQRGTFTLGEWRYLLEAGKIFGDVPYPVLKNIKGKQGSAYGRYQFTLMQTNEYLTDTYTTLQTEVMTNGIIFNYIPLIKKLNLREIASFKIAYGSISESHSKLMDLPVGTYGFTKPYSEVSIGFANLLGMFSVQYTRRLTDLNHPNVKKSGIGLSLLFSF